MKISSKTSLEKYLSSIYSGIYLSKLIDLFDKKVSGESKKLGIETISLLIIIIRESLTFEEFRNFFLNLFSAKKRIFDQNKLESFILSLYTYKSGENFEKYLRFGLDVPVFSSNGTTLSFEDK